jgi:hypothetical protein
MSTKTQSVITDTHLEKALSYEAYRQLIDDLLAQNRTTGDYKSEGIDIIHYTKMNVQRMNRWDKSAKILPELKESIEELSEKWIWVVLTEGWCGDAAQNIPTIVKIAELSEDIEIKFLLRDENPEVMDAYLTNGGRAIPKLICLDEETLEEIGTWGPRPAEVQTMMIDYKNNPTGTFQEFSEKLHKWYATDKSRTLQKEFLALIESWK